MKSNIVFALALGLHAATLQAQVVVGHPSAPALNAAQVSDIYQGKSQAATPLDLPEAAPVRTDFYRKATGKEPAQVRALWARLAFTGKAQPPRELPDAAAVRKAVAADPKAIAYLDKAAVDGSVKVLLELD